MSESSNIPNVKTTPKPFGVQIEWKWPDGCFWFSSLELQYLFDDGRLGKETISWPVSGKFISGLKAGERLQIRLRRTDKDGHVRDWSQGDWIEGVASADAGECLADIAPGWRASSDDTNCDGQQSVVFKADRFKVTDGVNDSGESTIQQQIQQAANAVIEATKAALARQDAAMADLASAQAAITECINQAVNNALANALKPGGLLYARK